jgi:hypothetical protein
MQPALAVFLPLRRRGSRQAAPILHPATISSLAVATSIATTLPARAADATGEPSSGAYLVAIVSHTPLWVWAVLAGLIWLGVKRTQPREVGLSGLVVLPLVLVMLSLFNLATSGQPFQCLAGAGIGALLGLASGLALERRYAATPLGNGRLLLRGEWSSLVLVLAVFIVHYVGNVLAVTDPELTHSDGFALVTGGLSGMFAAMLICRTVLRLRLLLLSTANA